MSIGVGLALSLHAQSSRAGDRNSRPVVTGIVVAGGAGDEPGAVEVRLPSSAGAATSGRAPVVALGAAGERGRFLRPEVGDEVIVAFLDGDPRRPVVLGGLWSVGVVAARPPAPVAPAGPPDEAVREVRSAIRQAIESGHGFPVATGIVIAPAGPRAESRVQIEFPWLPRDDSEETAWARVVPTPDAGRGAFYLPEVGDEVVVAFPPPDPRLPVVLGLLGGGEPPRLESAAPAGSPAEGRARGAAPSEGWCCRRGEIFPAPQPDCRELGGDFFPGFEEAERACLER